MLHKISLRAGTHLWQQMSSIYALFIPLLLADQWIILIFVEQSVGNQQAAGCWQQPVGLQ